MPAQVAREQEVLAAARAADAHDFVTALPEGCDTVVGRRGRLLPGGRRRRPAVARATIRDAPVGTRCRLPRALTTAIEECLEPDPAARPGLGSLAAAFDALPPSHRGNVEPPAPEPPLGQSLHSGATYEEHASFWAFSGANAR